MILIWKNQQFSDKIFQKNLNNFEEEFILKFWYFCPSSVHVFSDTVKLQKRFFGKIKRQGASLRAPLGAIASLGSSLRGLLRSLLRAPLMASLGVGVSQGASLGMS
jgi:hypothetical protein